MDIRADVRTLAVRQLSHDERRVLRTLTAYPDSYMTSVVDDNPAEALCWVARADHRIIGWGLLRWFEPRLQAAHNAYISVFVAPFARGKGIGRRLVHCAMTHGRQQNLRPCFYGATLQQRRFYRRCGAPQNSITPYAFPRTYWSHCRFIKNGLRA